MSMATFSSNQSETDANRCKHWFHTDRKIDTVLQGEKKLKNPEFK